MSIVAPILVCLALLAPAGEARPADATPSQPPAQPGPDAQGAATTAEQAAAPAGPAQQQAPAPAAQQQRREEEKDDNWIDFGHSFLEDKLFAPVFRVDRFFSDERDLEAERARSFLRWRNQLRFAEHQRLPSYTTELAANLRFPGLNKQLSRLQIEVLGQTKDTFSSVFPRTNPAPGEIPPPDSTVGTADAGLALRLWDTLQTHADVGVGITLALPPGEYVRLRFRFAQRPGLGVVSRQAITTFWRTDTSFGTTESVDFERPLAPWAVARASASTTVSESSRRFDWLGDLSVAAALKARVGSVVGWGIVGATGPHPPVSSHRFYVRLRRDFYRRWIFLELEPEYAWPYSTALGRHGVAAVMLRAEIQFQGNEGRPATATASAPAPAAPAETGRPPAPRSSPASDPEPKDPEPADRPAGDPGAVPQGAGGAPVPLPAHPGPG